MLATIVGSANGRSMSAPTIRLPGNSSRTSTQAMAVPITTLITATIAETTTVTRSAASAPGAVTASQKPAQPFSNDVTVSAANGRSTMTLSQRPAIPMPSGPTAPVTANLRRERVFGFGEGVCAGCRAG